MFDITSAAEISDPEERAIALSALIDEAQAAGQELARLRREALGELLDAGRTQTQIADLLGISRSRISMMLSAGSRPERSFFGNGKVTVAVGAKPEADRLDGSSMLSADALAAYETLAAAAKATGLEVEREVVPPPGLVDLNRSNLIVLTSPRILPFLGQVVGADKHVTFRSDDRGWYLTDHNTGTEYRSPRGAAEPATTDYAYVGRLPRPDGKGTFLYIAGIHAQGTLAAAQYVADNLKEIYREIKARRFSTIVSCTYKPDGDRQIVSFERITPFYRAEGA